MSKCRTIQKKSDIAIVQEQLKIRKETIIKNNTFLSDVLNIIYFTKSKQNEDFDMVI